jgi:hypothetical protein
MASAATVALQPRRQLCEAGHERRCFDCLMACAGLTISALLAAIAVALNRRVRIVDRIKGIDFNKVGLRRWLVDYKIAQRGTVPPTAALTGSTAIRRLQPPFLI